MCLTLDQRVCLTVGQSVCLTVDQRVCLTEDQRVCLTGDQSVCLRQRFVRNTGYYGRGNPGIEDFTVMITTFIEVISSFHANPTQPLQRPDSWS